MDSSNKIGELQVTTHSIRFDGGQCDGQGNHTLNISTDFDDKEAEFVLRRMFPEWNIKPLSNGEWELSSTNKRDAIRRKKKKKMDLLEALAQNKSLLEKE